MRLSNIIFLLFISNILSAQFYEELVEIKYEQNLLQSIQVYEDIPYIDQMLGGIVVNTDDNWYTFTGMGSDTKLYTADIATGDILYEVDVPQIQMLQFQPGSDDLVGIAKGNPTGEVALATVNYKTGATSSFPEIGVLQDATIFTHNSAINTTDQLFYFVGSLSNSNNWSIIVVDLSNGSLVKSFEIMPDNKTVAGLAYDADRDRLIGLLGVSPDGKSLVEIDVDSETITEIRAIPEIINTFGGHRYWAYNDADNEFFIIGLDGTGESYLYVLDSTNGDLLFQHLYEDDGWIMEEHSPLELRYSPNTKQLLGLRKGPALPPVGISYIKNTGGSLKVSPNPVTTDQVHVRLSGAEIIDEISVYSASGLLLSTSKVNRSNFSLPVGQYSAGLYFLVGVSSSGIYRGTFVVH